MPERLSSYLDGGNLFSEDDYSRFADTLGVSELSDFERNEIRLATLHFIALYLIDMRPASGEDWKPVIPIRGARRAAYNRLYDAANRLKEALEDEELICLPEEGTLISFSIEDVERLAASALEILQKIPKGGADKELARSILVRELAPVFERVTGRKPGRSFDTTAHKRGDRGGRGQFFRFCLEVLDCFLPGAEKGLDDVIKLTLRNLG